MATVRPRMMTARTVYERRLPRRDSYRHGYNIRLGIPKDLTEHR